MGPRIMSVIEQAFALAKTGKYISVVEIERHMINSGLAHMDDLQGRDLRRQLKSLCDEARGIAPAASAITKPLRRSKLKTRRIIP